MQIEYKAIVAEVTDLNAIRKAIQSKKFLSIVNGLSILTHVTGNKYKLEGEDPFDNMEIIFVMSEDHMLSVNGERFSPLSQLLETMKPSLFIGDYEVIDLLRLSKDGMYRILEEKLNHEYDISSAVFRFKELDENGYASIYAYIDAFRRN
jgi:hypothetical protein